MIANLTADLIKLIINAEPQGFQLTGAQVRELEKNLDKLNKRNETLVKTNSRLTKEAGLYRKAIASTTLRREEEKHRVALAKTTDERRKNVNEIKRNERQVAKLSQGLKEEQVATRITAQRKKELVDGYIKTDVSAKKLVKTNQELNTLVHKSEPLTQKEIARVKTLATEQQFLTKQLKGQVPTTKTLGQQMKGLEQRYHQTGDKMGYYRQGYNTLFTAQQKGVKLTKAQREQMAAFGHSMKQAISPMTRFAQKMFIWAFGWTLAYSGIRLVIQGFTSLFKQAWSTQDAMARVNAVLSATGEQSKGFGKLEKAIYSYGRTATVSFKETADAMYHLATVGLKADEVMAGYTHILDLATATQTNVKTTGLLMAGAYKLFGDKITDVHTKWEKFRRLSDILTYVYSQHQVELSEIAEAFTYVGGTAGLINISFEDLAATIGFLNTQMVKGSRAGTSLFNTFVQVAESSEKLREKFHVAFDPSLPINFRDVIEQIHEDVKNNAISAETLANIYQVFGRRGGRAIAVMIGKWDDYNKALEETGNVADGLTEKLRNIQETTFTRQMGIVMKDYWADMVAGIDKATKGYAEMFKESKEFKQDWNTMIQLVGTLTGKEEEFATLNKGIQKIRRMGIEETRGSFLELLTFGRYFGVIDEEHTKFLDEVARKRKAQIKLLREEQKILNSLPNVLAMIVDLYPDIIIESAKYNDIIKEGLNYISGYPEKLKEAIGDNEKCKKLAGEITGHLYNQGKIQKDQIEIISDTLALLLRQRESMGALVDTQGYLVEKITETADKLKEEYKLNMILRDIRNPLIESLIKQNVLYDKMGKRLQTNNALAKLTKLAHDQGWKGLENQFKELEEIGGKLKIITEGENIRLSINGKILDLKEEQVLRILQIGIGEDKVKTLLGGHYAILDEILKLEKEETKTAREHRERLAEIVNKEGIWGEYAIKRASIEEKYQTILAGITEDEGRNIIEKAKQVELAELLYEHQEKWVEELGKAKEEIQGPIKDGLKDMLNLEIDWTEVAEGGLSKHEQQWRKLGEIVSNVFDKIGDAWQDKVLDRMFEGIDELMDVKLSSLTQKVQEVWTAGGRRADIPIGATTATVAAGILPSIMQDKITEGDKKVVNVSIKNNEAIKSELSDQTSKLTETSFLAASYIINALWASASETIKYNEDGTQTIVKSQAGTGAQIGSLLGSLTAFIPGIGPVIATAMMALGSSLGGAIGASIKTTEDIGNKAEDNSDKIEERLEWIVGSYDDTNKELKIANRNLVAIRNSFEGWILPESAYFSRFSRFQHGGIVPGSPSQAVPAILHGQEVVLPAGTRPDVNVGTMSIYINNANEAEEIIRTIEQSWVVKSKRAYQGV